MGKSRHKYKHRYECKDNDVIIEMDNDPTEIYISINGETGKTVVGIEDLKNALKQFKIK